VNELKLLIESAPPLIIDIRSNITYKIGHIPGSINILEDSLETIIDNAKPFPKNRKIIVVCPNGDRSKRYAAYLLKQGYEAYNLTAGIIAWKDAAYEFEKSL
jgi:cysteine synthase B